LRILTSSIYSIPGESFDPFRGYHTHGPAAEQTSY
jgi:hypothetical protein